MTTILWLFVALVALNVVDVLTTLRILSLGGRERNKYVLRVMQVIGPLPAMLATKVPPITGLGYLLDSTPAWAMAALCGWYVWVVANNIDVLRALKSRG